MDQIKGDYVLYPRLGSDRIKALLSLFTASANSCPFYNKKVRSACSLDPSSRRAWDCRGICFNEGFCCNLIIDKSAEIEELIKFLSFIRIKKK